MRRGTKPAKSKVEAKPPVARKSPKDDGARVRDLEKRLAEALQREAEGLEREAEALEQQTATSEILRAISSSPIDVQPVMQTIVESAIRLADAEHAMIGRAEGDHIRWLAAAGTTLSGLPQGISLQPISRSLPSGRAILDRQTTQVEDISVYGDEFPGVAAAYRELGVRTILATPLLREGNSVGVILIRRTAVRPFTDQQIALLKTFADQAVIAIENVRLFTELQTSNRELTTALDTQTATSDILRVISQSQTDVQPVFDAILSSAVRLLAGYTGLVTRIAGDQIELAALTSTDAAGDGAVRATFPRRLHSEDGYAQAIRARTPLNIADAHTDSRWPEDWRASARIRGYRSGVMVPLLRHAEPIGAIAVSRREPGGFTDDEIALLQTFADQAVIAIENVRLFNETKEALERQMATSEILQVIATSPTDVQPVLDALVESVGRLCEAADTFLLLVEGDQLRVAALHPSVEGGVISNPIQRGWVAGRAVMELRTVHVEDLANAQSEFPLGWEIAVRLGHRTALAMPLVRKGEPIGALFLRRREVRQFSDKEIALLQTFADQAVIAIENVRLFNETKEALEQQTATAEILRVISTSPTNLQPVLDAVVKSAARFCGAPDASVFRLEGEALRADAHHGPVSQPPGFLVPVVRGSVAGRSVLERRAVGVTDLQGESEEFPEGSALARQTGQRATLSVPLLREGTPIGAILLRRAEAVPFSDKQIALLQTFADQAVIAIENVRLFNELQEKNQALTQAHAQVTEALEQQTATSEILSVISSSPTNIQPVFDTIVKSVARLCDGMFASLHRFDGDLLHWVAQHNYTAEGLEAMRKRYPMRAGRDTASGRAVIDRTVIHIRDFERDPDAPPSSREIARAFGYRSLITVPMLREGQPVGAIAVARRDGPFSAGQIALLKTFADQAVIAIENVRLFKELEARNRDLTESLEQQTATSEILRAISSSPTELQPVLDAVAENAARVCGASDAIIRRVEGDLLAPAAHFGSIPMSTALVARPITRDSAIGRAALERRTIHLFDLPNPEFVREYPEGVAIQQREGFRTIVTTPLLREGIAIGVIAIRRLDPRPFTDKQIALLQTFADQAVIAIENVRLFKELEVANRELEAASQHKSEFLANMSHELRTPLNAIIGFSEVLSERMFGELNEKQAEYLKDIYASGTHLLSLINDILDLSKIEAGRMELELTDFDLPQAIDNALTLVRERAGRRGIALHQSVEAHLGEIRGDERKVKQVLLNLLSNALKFTPEGGRVEVLARVVGGMAEISVTDTGVGIAPEDQEAVFEEFRQVGTAEKKAEGTGLGLTLCRKFIELHGGKIWVTSHVGVGSTFTFTIPVRR